jgi:PAS domain S-box-containing protein
MLSPFHLAPFFKTSRTFHAVALDLQGRYTYANPLFCQEFKVIAEDFIGRTFQETVHPDDVATCIEAARECLESPGKSIAIPIRKPLPGGDYYWMQWEFSVYTDEAGQAEGIFCLGYNMTSLEEAKQSLDQLIRFQRIVMQLATDFVNTPLEDVGREIQQMLQTVGQFVESDRVYVFEYDFEQGIASNTYEWCAHGIEPEIDNLQGVPIDHIPQWVSLHRTGQVMHIPRVLDLAADDQMRMMLEAQNIQSLITLPMIDEGQCVGFIGFDSVRQERRWQEDEIALLRVLTELLTNVRARQRANQELLELNASLERRIEERTAELVAINEELEAFSYSVSHDLKTPLRHILSFLELIRRKIDVGADAELGQYFQYVLDAAADMGLIIEDLLHFSRVSKQTLQKKPLDVKGLIEGVLWELATEQHNRQVAIELGTLPSSIEADPQMLKLLWLNLLSNALKYTRTRSQAQIEIDSYPEGTEIVFSVRDNGVGFDMRFYDRLFTAFQRLHTREEFEGTGIGLATAKRIVQKHGGRIWAEGQLGQGAAFWFTLPKGE